ncbi:beta-1,6-N-acetylglucosaminyltransferase [Scheffersomyces xylosifermentans]|uniref:beta-1,6-N-acetylglucosaminyltransferase n=1 Tax=Scheffersomyces xylosifermentans TaxID=1304137 RepID=UPI00315DE827
MRPASAFMGLIVHSYVASALWPVRDFRVEALQSSITGSKKDVVGIKNKVNTPGKQANVDPVNNQEVSSNSPSIALNDDIQMIFTDSASSIYYLYANISDTSTGYNEQFPLLLDTGSSISWLYNQSCHENGCSKADIKKFNDFSSPLHSDSTFQLTYTGEAISGDIISLKDNNLEISIGDSRTHFNNLSIGITSDSPQMFDGYDISGLLGISSSLSGDPKRNIIHQYYASSQIDKEIFALFLTSADQEVHYLNSNGENEQLPEGFGGLILMGSEALDNENSFTNGSEIVYVNVEDNYNSYWLINIIEVQTTNGSSQNLLSNSGSFQAIIDTGTTGIVLPVQEADAIHESLFGDAYVSDNKGNYAFPCDSDSSILFSVGDSELKLESKYFMGDEYTSQKGLEGMCASKIQGIDGYNYWVLGASFLNKFYTIFDLSNKQIGFGELGIRTLDLKEQEVRGDEKSSSETVHSSSLSTSTRASTSSSSLSSSSSSTSSSKSSSSKSSKTTTKALSTTLATQSKASSTSTSSAQNNKETSNTSNNTSNSGSNISKAGSFSTFMALLLPLSICVFF